MISNNADVIAKELQDYVDEVERKLKAMVTGFAGEVALAASARTKIIPDEALVTAYWQKIYSKRQDKFGIQMEPGYHAGAWKYYEGKLMFQDPTIYSSGAMHQKVLIDAESNYKLGDKFSIGMTGPVAEYAGAGASGATNAIMSAYSANVKRYYDQG